MRYSLAFLSTALVGMLERVLCLRTSLFPDGQLSCQPSAADKIAARCTKSSINTPYGVLGAEYDLRRTRSVYEAPVALALTNFNRS